MNLGDQIKSQGLGRGSNWPGSLASSHTLLKVLR